MLTYILSILACLFIALPLFIWSETRLFGEDVKRFNIILFILVSFIPVVNSALALIIIFSRIVLIAIELASKDTKVWFKAKRKY